ncbi:hypothetical protein BB560_004661 [Smittium megazygosporum]|uniref:Uncharacterized protein n=1 Tax=Smittium megazygosporum TaxID=133381 RepID=A0A2T9Y257_9FUNG|nr:hypothetical protein BB560_006739 [Smittium megazygosporum]PVV00938.1 hypothetical protein BB560_004661 [Smittium megazygosporum]
MTSQTYSVLNPSLSFVDTITFPSKKHFNQSFLDNLPQQSQFQTSYPTIKKDNISTADPPPYPTLNNFNPSFLPSCQSEADTFGQSYYDWISSNGFSTVFDSSLDVPFSDDTFPNPLPILNPHSPKIASNRSVSNSPSSPLQSPESLSSKLPKLVSCPPGFETPKLHPASSPITLSSSSSINELALSDFDKFNDNNSSSNHTNNPHPHPHSFHNPGHPNDHNYKKIIPPTPTSPKNNKRSSAVVREKVALNKLLNLIDSMKNLPLQQTAQKY